MHQKTISLTFVFILSAILIYGCVETGKNGELHTKIKDDTVCLYIDNTNFKGDYTVYVQIVGNSKIYAYKNNYESHYPNQNQCIMLDNSRFSDWDGLKFGEHYTISLWSYHKEFYGDHRGSFCIIKDNGVLRLAKPKGGSCPTQ